MILTTAIRTLVLVGAVSVGLVACGDGDGDDSVDGPTVVATTTQLADIAANVAGERAQVVGILPVNADPHDYEPKPSDAEALIESSMVLKSGGDLDAWMDELIDNSGTEAPVVEILDVVETLDSAEQGVDPHWWHDPRNAVLAVGEIADRLAEVDPESEAVFEANAMRYAARIVSIDRAIKGCIGEIPPAERKIVTSHDALAYLADRYELAVVGSAIPALTTQAQASAGEVAELVDLIRNEGVTAVFGEAGLSNDLVDAIAEDAGAEIGGQLYADTLGPEGSGAETYLSALTVNASALVEGLSGGSMTCIFSGQP